MFRKILLAYDGSDGAKTALRIGMGLAKSLSAEIHSISVEEELPHYAATMGEVEIIVNYAKEGSFDLLLAGYHGHSRIFERVMGSTAQSIIRLSPCSVLLAK